ncbi:hypothetical protein LEP1GSC043_4510 [Leptospira weilii str. Ecochallenge]|uniref:Uncharacterized protein n=4 Tax=Leptospira weilii TaxID=28184 RepID=N1U204_9LEPT|nr:hypothetical protein LEP1GSC038_2679 [Leptospira weilii str. 2006001855]EMY14528.1 hypothetical protein LEP1GSC043_4510 [Leptospira weilii str. Ecochallenge]
MGGCEPFIISIVIYQDSITRRKANGFDNRYSLFTFDKKSNNHLRNLSLKTTKGLQKMIVTLRLNGYVSKETKEISMKNRQLFSNSSNRSPLQTQVSPNFNFICRLFCLIFILSISIANVGCKPSIKDQVEKILSDREIPLEEKIRQTSFLLLGDRLKEIEISPSISPTGDKTGTVKVTLAMGGNTALTFLGQKEYKERMKLEAALLSFRILQTLKNLPIESFRISIIKPYYVKNSPTDSIEEFEVFRAKMEKNSLIQIKGFETVDSFAADSYDSPEPEVLDVMVQIVRSWKVELDELNRVEIK